MTSDLQEILTIANELLLSAAWWDSRDKAHATALREVAVMALKFVAVKKAEAGNA